jgi:hypothetical protein
VLVVRQGVIDNYRNQVDNKHPPRLNQLILGMVADLVCRPIYIDLAVLVVRKGVIDNYRQVSFHYGVSTDLKVTK